MYIFSVLAVFLLAVEHSGYNIPMSMFALRGLSLAGLLHALVKSTLPLITVYL